MPRALSPEPRANSGLGISARLLAGLVAVMGSLTLLAGADEPPQKREPFRYDSKGRRDPFAVLVREGRQVGVTQGARAEGSKPVLYGILWDPGGASIALINEAEAKVGDTVNGYHVKEIRQDAVVLEKGEELVVLQIEFETSPSVLPPGATTGGEEP